MKIEQNSFVISDAGLAPAYKGSGYIDIFRSLSALNGKSVHMTKRHKGKYKPLAALIRVRTFGGTVNIETLNSGYPTRNAVVLSGVARDAMLKSAGVSRSNLESYQKGLRILMDTVQSDSNTWLPNGFKPGTMDTDPTDPDPDEYGTDAYGWNVQYDYTDLVHADGSAADVDVRGTMCMLGSSTVVTDGSGNTFFPLIHNWTQFRHDFTPSDSADDIAENAFSKIMQQGQTADSIIDIVEDEQDEKPYQLSDFTTRTISTVCGSLVGNPVSDIICVPLGLMKVSLNNNDGATPPVSLPTSFQIEVVGVTEL